MLPVVGLCLGVSLRVRNWQAGFRLFLVLGLPIVAIALLVQLLTKLPEPIADWAATGAVALGLAAIGWQVLWFLLNLRRAGALILQAGFSEFRTNALVGAGLFVLWGALAIPRLNNIKEAGVFLTLSLAFIFIMRATHAFQVREKGILYSGRLVPWDRMASIAWINVLHKDALRVTLKDSAKVIKIPVPLPLRATLADYLLSRAKPDKG